jgi:hypothetical protein
MITKRDSARRAGASSIPVIIQKSFVYSLYSLTSQDAANGTAIETRIPISIRTQITKIAAILVAFSD